MASSVEFCSLEGIRRIAGIKHIGSPEGSMLFPYSVTFLLTSSRQPVELDIEAGDTLPRILFTSTASTNMSWIAMLTGCRRLLACTPCIQLQQSPDWCNLNTSYSDK